MTDHTTTGAPAPIAAHDLESASAPAHHAQGRVVVGLDGSPLSIEALEAAADVAKWKGWALHVVHAYHLVYPAWPVPGAVGIPADFESGVVQAALAAMQAESEAVLGVGSGVEVIYSAVDGPAGNVLEQVSESADLLVIGSRGYGGVRRALLGSVGNHLAHHAKCALLILRASAPSP